MRNMAKINPFDIIKTTQDIPAKVIINREAPCTEAIDIELPKGTLLFSNTHNYKAITQLSFVPQEKKQFDTIKNLYIHKTTHVAKTLGYTYSINATDLNNKFEFIERFDYKQLQPDSTAHIYLLAYIYLVGKIQTVDNAQNTYASFLIGSLLKKQKLNFENFLLTHQEATNIIAYQIQNQIKMRQQ
jgi:hypothetical protein